jgi:hypothetical protein
MKVLIACEFSGMVRRAFRERGHDAWSCDLLPADDESPYHMQGDAVDVIETYRDPWALRSNGGWDSWDMVIAHPPCTYLANSGVRWLKTDESRWAELDKAAKFFNFFLDLDVEKVCVENPIPHKYAVERLGGRKYTQIVQPWHFGDKEKKATCLWLKGLQPLKPTADLEKMKEEMDGMPLKVVQRVWQLPPSKDRWKLRSITMPGLANAMAEQWG